MVCVNVRVVHDLDDLANDMLAIRARVRPEMRGVVREGIQLGAGEARAFAKVSAGTHGKHYHRSITASMHVGLGLFGNTISGEYGPDSAKKQGGMSFERGSRNQRPHNDLAKSADLIGPAFERAVDDKVGEWFW